MGTEIFRTCQVEDLHFKYKLDRSSNIAIVEILSSPTVDVSHEKIAAFICLSDDVSPLKMIYFVQEREQWQMLQFTEFYNNKCRVHSKTPVDKSEVVGLL